MATRVVNKFAEPYDIYIGRGSKWGNPFSHKEGTKAEIVVGSREEAIWRYRDYLLDNRALYDALPELVGKVLGCYCKPLPCHGDVLAELADRTQIEHYGYPSEPQPPILPV